MFLYPLLLLLSGVWYGSCSAQDRKKLQKVVNVAQSITQTSLPSIDPVYTSRCLGKAASIIKDFTHPGHSLFQLLPPGKRYKSLRSRPNRFKNGFFPAAIRLLNGPLTPSLFHRIETLQCRKRPFGPSSLHRPQSHPGPTPISLHIYPLIPLTYASQDTKGQF